MKLRNASPPGHARAGTLLRAVTVCLDGATALCRRDQRPGFKDQVGRVFVAAAIGVPPAYLIADLLPGVDGFWDTLSVAIAIAFVGLLLVRQVVVPPFARTLLPHLPHRVLVLGTGADARAVAASLSSPGLRGVDLVGFYRLENMQDCAVPANRVIAGGASLEETVARLGIREIVVAVRQQRGGVLPLRSLLDCRLSGVLVTDLERFYERVHGRVPVESLKASWLIYGNGFRQGRLRTFVKRLFDVLAGTILLVATLPAMGIVALLIAFEGGGPVIYRQERVGFGGRPFTMLKFRSMAADAERDGKAAWAAVNDVRVTRVGRVLRQTRIDELPQLVNVVKGDMSLVGPRPERPAFVSMLSDRIPFYDVRHSVKPGITGWAQVRYCYGATIEQSVKKLEYDLYYVKNHTIFLDFMILLETVRVVLRGGGAR